MSAQQGFAEVNGTRLYYEAAGAGPALVLVHGFTLDARMWDTQIDDLARHYRVIRYDQRGFGRSALPGSEQYTHADDLRALVLADAMVEGHKWSAQWNDAVIPVWQGARQEGVAVGKARWLAHAGLFGPAQEQPAVAAALARMIGDYSGWHWVNRDPHRRAAVPTIDRLDEITLPTLVVVGERDDDDFQAQSDTLARRIPGARKAVIPGVGHMSNMENPATFNRLLLDFLAEVGGAASARAFH